MRIFHSISALALIAVLFFGTGMRTYITVNFFIYQNEIAKEKCENKEKPKMKCNGKCYLAKQLKQTEQKSKTDAPVSPERFAFQEVLFAHEKNDFIFFSFNLNPESTEYFLGLHPDFLQQIPSPPPRIL